MTDADFPDRLADEAARQDWMTRPSEALRSFVPSLGRGPLIVLGAGGKMGPSLCRLARRAADETGTDLEVIAVSRFSDPAKRGALERDGIQTIACDLMGPAALAELPKAPHVIYLVGLKFGTQDDPARTWAVNTLIPAAVTEHFAGSRIVALSTGNVYPLVPITEGGSVEGDPLTPLGEYANACVARERLFQYASRHHDTPGVLVRLNYAVDVYYGVLVDLARRIAAGEAVDLTTGYLNCIWQRDANDMILRALDLAEVPMRPLNLTGPDVLHVRDLAERLGTLLGEPVRFTGTESPTAFLNDASAAFDALGLPPTPLDVQLRWTADWVARGAATLGKPTRFEVRDGSY